MAPMLPYGVPNDPGIAWNNQQVGGGLQGTSGAPLSGGGGLSGTPPQLGSPGLTPGTNASQSQYGTGVVPGMLDVYNQLLGQNQQHYQNVLNAYQGGQSNLQGALPGINSGYSNALSGVMSTLGMGQVLGQNGNWGVAGPAAQAIQQTFENTFGATEQNLIGAGLGNTTGLSAMENMNAQSAGRAYGALGANLAQTAAGYQGQFGMAQLAQAMQGLGMETGLTQAGLGPLGQQFANTAGSLTGGFGASAYGGQQYPYGTGGLGPGSQSGFGNHGGPPPSVQDPYGMYGGGGFGGTGGPQPYPSPPPGPGPGFSDITGGADTFANASGYGMGGFSTTNYGNLGDLGNGFGGGVGTFDDLSGFSDSSIGDALGALTGDIGGY